MGGFIVGDIVTAVAGIRDDDNNSTYGAIGEIVNIRREFTFGIEVKFIHKYNKSILFNAWYSDDELDLYVQSSVIFDTREVMSIYE